MEACAFPLQCCNAESVGLMESCNWAPGRPWMARGSSPWLLWCPVSTLVEYDLTSERCLFSHSKSFRQRLKLSRSRGVSKGRSSVSVAQVAQGSGCRVEQFSWEWEQWWDSPAILLGTSLCLFLHLPTPCASRSSATHGSAHTGPWFLFTHLPSVPTATALLVSHANLLRRELTLTRSPYQTDDTGPNDQRACGHTPLRSAACPWASQLGPR